MAAALRCAARKICGRALQRPQAFFTTAAEAAVKEGRRRRLLPRIDHTRSSLRRFTSAESTTLPNNNKVISNTAAQPTEVLGKQIESTKHELLDLLAQMEAESCMGAEHKELQEVLKVNNNRFLADEYRRSMLSGIATMAAGIATAIVGTKVLFPRREED